MHIYRSTWTLVHICIYVYIYIYVYAYIANFRCTCMVDQLTRCNIHDYRFDAATAVAHEFNNRSKTAKVREPRG